MQEQLSERLLSRKQVAAKVGRTGRTITRWVKKGWLQPVYIDHGSTHRTVGFRESEVDQLLRRDVIGGEATLLDQLRNAKIVLKGRARTILEDFDINTRRQLAHLDLREVSKLEGVGRKTRKELQAAIRWAAKRTTNQEG